MRSAIINLDEGTADPAALAERVAASAPADCDPRRPDLVLGFLPAGGPLQEILDRLAEAWPESLRLGCEAVTQFTDGSLTGGGSLQLFWFRSAAHRPRATVVRGAGGQPLASAALDAAAGALADTEAAFVLATGLSFPIEQLLEHLRGALADRAPVIAGGLASQHPPFATGGARVFLDRTLYENAGIVVALPGVQMRVEIVRGWDPASPIYVVTAAEGHVLHEIDGEPATEWFRRFFSIDGELAPLPETAYRFPLIVEGPKPERRFLYRSMQAFDEPPGAVTFWGDFETGDHIRLGVGNDASLLRTAAGLPTGDSAEAAVLYSCVGREQVLGTLAEQEVATIHRALAGASLGGFFTFGEIGPSRGGPLAFYNHTAVLALLSEVAE